MSNLKPSYRAIMLLAVLIYLCSIVNGQVYYGAGIYGAKKPGGTALIGVQIKKWSPQLDINRGLIRVPSYFTLTGGYTVENVRIYTGPSYRLVGSTHHQDRYVHDGTTTVITDNLSTNCLSMAYGVNVILGPVTLDVGYKHQFVVGVVFVWRKSE